MKRSLVRLSALLVAILLSTSPASSVSASGGHPGEPPEVHLFSLGGPPGDAWEMVDRRAQLRADLAAQSSRLAAVVQGKFIVVTNDGPPPSLPGTLDLLSSTTDPVPLPGPVVSAHPWIEPLWKGLMAIQHPSPDPQGGPGPDESGAIRVEEPEEPPTGLALDSFGIGGPIPLHELGPGPDHGGGSRLPPPSEWGLGAGWEASVQGSDDWTWGWWSVLDHHDATFHGASREGDVVSASTGSGTCNVRSEASPSWDSDYQALAANEHALARQLLDWGRFSPNIDLGSFRSRGGTTEFVGGFQHNILLALSGAEDWTGDWATPATDDEGVPEWGPCSDAFPGGMRADEKSVAIARVALGQMAWSVMYHPDYVHLPVIVTDIVEVDVDVDKVQLAAASDPSAGPWELDFETEIWDELVATYGVGSWAQFLADAQSQGLCTGRNRFRCMTQWLKLANWSDFVHVQYVVDRWEWDSYLPGLGANAVGYAKGGQPWSIVTWDECRRELRGVNQGVMSVTRTAAHEISHHMDSMDEYSLSGKQCSDTSGYLDELHSNQDAGDSSCTDWGCLLRGSNSGFQSSEGVWGHDWFELTLCPTTRGQVALRDSDRADPYLPTSADGDCVYDAHDSEPAAFLRDAPLKAVQLEWTVSGPEIVPQGWPFPPGYAMFAGVDPVAEAKAFLAASDILTENRLLSAERVLLFPGYAYDCGVPKQGLSGSSPWSVTINELVDVQVRYQGAPLPGVELSDKLNGGLHPVARLPVFSPSSVGYSFEHVAVPLRFGQTITQVVDPQGNPGPQYVVWSSPPAGLLGRDLEVVATTDTGNRSDGTSALDSAQLNACDAGSWSGWGDLELIGGDE